MIEKQTIDALISVGKLQEAIDAATANMQEAPADAVWPFLRGKAYWRLGQHGRAISDYELAVSLDPQSPAAAALEMSRDIMDYYNADLLNP